MYRDKYKYRKIETFVYIKKACNICYTLSFPPNKHTKKRKTKGAIYKRSVIYLWSEQKRFTYVWYLPLSSHFQEKDPLEGVDGLVQSYTPPPVQKPAKIDTWSLECWF